jgi:hypothetical protein
MQTGILKLIAILRTHLNSLSTLISLNSRPAASVAGKCVVVVKADASGGQDKIQALISNLLVAVLCYRKSDGIVRAEERPSHQDYAISLDEA